MENDQHHIVSLQPTTGVGGVRRGGALSKSSVGVFEMQTGEKSCFLTGVAGRVTKLLLEGGGAGGEQLRRWFGK